MRKVSLAQLGALHPSSIEETAVCGAEIFQGDNAVTQRNARMGARQGAVIEDPVGRLGTPDHERLWLAQGDGVHALAPAEQEGHAAARRLGRAANRIDFVSGFHVDSRSNCRRWG